MYGQSRVPLRQAPWRHPSRRDIRLSRFDHTKTFPLLRRTMNLKQSAGKKSLSQPTGLVSPHLSSPANESPFACHRSSQTPHPHHPSSSSEKDPHTPIPAPILPSPALIHHTQAQAPQPIPAQASPPNAASFQQQHPQNPNPPPRLPHPRRAPYGAPNRLGRQGRRRKRWEPTWQPLRVQTTFWSNRGRTAAMMVSCREFGFSSRSFGALS